MAKSKAKTQTASTSAVVVTDGSPSQTPTSPLKQRAARKRPNYSEHQDGHGDREDAAYVQESDSDAPAAKRLKKNGNKTTGTGFKAAKASKAPRKSKVGQKAGSTPADGGCNDDSTKTAHTNGFNAVQDSSATVDASDALTKEQKRQNDRDKQQRDGVLIATATTSPLDDIALSMVRRIKAAESLDWARKAELQASRRIAGSDEALCVCKQCQTAVDGDEYIYAVPYSPVMPMTLTGTAGKIPGQGLVAPPDNSDVDATMVQGEDAVTSIAYEVVQPPMGRQTKSDPQRTRDGDIVYKEWRKYHSHVLFHSACYAKVLLSSCGGMGNTEVHDKAAQCEEIVTAMQNCCIEQSIAGPKQVAAETNEARKLNAVEAITLRSSQMATRMFGHIEAIISCDEIWSQLPEPMYSKLNASHKMLIIDAAVNGLASEFGPRGGIINVSGRGLVNMIALLSMEAIDEMTRQSRHEDDVDALTNEAYIYLSKHERRQPIMRESYTRECHIKAEIRKHINAFKASHGCATPVDFVNNVSGLYGDLKCTAMERDSPKYRAGLLLTNMQACINYGQML